MWMTSYISEIKKQFRDKYKFVPCGGTKDDPIFNNIPDGEYPMLLDGKIDYVRVEGVSISCGNYTPKSN
jgi:hypothetical protein